MKTIREYIFELTEDLIEKFACSWKRKQQFCKKQYFVRTKFGTIINLENKYITGNQKHDNDQYQNIYIKMY